MYTCDYIVGMFIFFKLVEHRNESSQKIGEE